MQPRTCSNNQQTHGIWGHNNSNNSSACNDHTSTNSNNSNVRNNSNNELAMQCLLGRFVCSPSPFSRSAAMHISLRGFPEYEPDSKTPMVVPYITSLKEFRL